MNKPHVVVHVVASVDGRISLGPDRTGFENMGDERWQAILASNEADGERFRRLEFLHKPQVFLEGSGSFVREGDDLKPLPAFEGDPKMLYQDYLPDTIVHRAGRKGWFAAIDGRGRLREGVKEFEGWEGGYVLHLVSYGVPPEYLAHLQREEIPYLIAPEKRVDLKCTMEKLKDKLGVACVVSTAGGKLNGALLRAGLVDEINIELFPAVIGGFETPSLFDSPELKPGECPTRLKLISAHVQAEGRVWLRYAVVREQTIKTA